MRVHAPPEGGSFRRAWLQSDAGAGAIVREAEGIGGVSSSVSAGWSMDKEWRGAYLDSLYREKLVVSTTCGVYMSYHGCKKHTV